MQGIAIVLQAGGFRTHVQDSQLVLLCHKRNLVAGGRGVD
jgi:hypothetical protein